MYTLSSIAQRAGLVGAAAALVVATVFPAASAFADALNPLTERSLLLSSSAPGWQDTDGSGNSSSSLNSIGENYAPAGSGPNGKKTGQTFTFKVSSTAEVKGFSLQYCTTAAGLCQAPGNNLGDDRDEDRETNAEGHPNQTSDLDFVGNFIEGAAAGQFQVSVNDAPQTGWSFAKDNLENDTNPLNPLTGKNNYITLTNENGGSIASGAKVEIKFVPNETNTYITNPGADEFFVKINTYSSHEDLLGIHNEPNEANHTVIDGGVTVANVMTDSIHITTKVLETMAFSVGTQNRDNMDISTSGGTVAGYHGKCDAVQQINNNQLQLGNSSAEFSLETGRAHDVFSYWRLSSNSSGGATVYYSGDTLRNTVGDSIADMPNKAPSTPGTEQFGLGFVDAALDTRDTTPINTWAADWLPPSSYPFRTMAGQAAWENGVSPTNPNYVSHTDDRDFTDLEAQAASSDYDSATGSIYEANAAPGTAQFKFLSSSLTAPERIAQQNETVISCATAKVRYVANIGADTPAGVYTTKINYLAAPQY